ncbi:MAG: acetyl-CoA carboxylase carboxyltransferase subunit beta [Chloroflexi bacterium]|nr:acetyl-CoA carboxylase carboxyltransferase subunit beta [Chloroflexota bacterium]
MDKSDGPWQKCPQCQQLLYIKELERNLKVCPKCQHHFTLSAWERIDLLCDEGSFEETDRGLTTADPLNFSSGDKSYRQRLQEAQALTDLTEAVVSGWGRTNEHEIALAVCDFRFLAGSMGSVVGEKVTRTIERALDHHKPLVIVAASGGARMHEGIFSLMQMAKTTTALARLGPARVPYISVLTNQTLGGVTASFASLADAVIAEPQAIIGFAGPRVIEQVTKQRLPPNINTSEFRLEHGFLDMVVPRREIKETIGRLLRLYAAGAA